MSDAGYYEQRLAADHLRRCDELASPRDRQYLQAEIDGALTGGGTIVCKDGFTATTVGEEEFLHLASGLGVTAECVEVDESSLFFLVSA